MQCDIGVLFLLEFYVARLRVISFEATAHLAHADAHEPFREKPDVCCWTNIGEQLCELRHIRMRRHVLAADNLPRTFRHFTTCNNVIGSRCSSYVEAKASR